VWRKGNTVFHIDTVKDVGGIFEIELRKSGKITEKDKLIFRSYQEKLLPFLGEVIKGSNIDLVVEKRVSKTAVVWRRDLQGEDSPPNDC
jgi:hypothetical protein